VVEKKKLVVLNFVAEAPGKYQNRPLKKAWTINISQKTTAELQKECALGEAVKPVELLPLVPGRSLGCRSQQAQREGSQGCRGDLGWGGIGAVGVQKGTGAAPLNWPNSNCFP
jgi:hypothetical protein